MNITHNQPDLKNKEHEHDASQFFTIETNLMVTILSCIDEMLLFCTSKAQWYYFLTEEVLIVRLLSLL